MGPRWLPLVFALAGLSGVAPARQAPELEQRLVSATGPQRIELLVELVELHRQEPVDSVEQRAREALRLLDDHPDTELETRLRIGFSWVLSASGATDEALANARRARDLAVASGDGALEARADYHVAVALWYRSEVRGALDAAERARAQQAEFGDRAALASTLTLLGAIHRSRSAYDEALARHLEALEISHELGDDSGVARSNNNIGVMYWSLGQNEDALTYMRPALEAFRAQGRERSLASGLSNFGLILVELGQASDALPYLEEGRALAEKLRQPRLLAKVISNLGFAHEELGAADVALGLHREALALREELQDQWGMSRSLGNLTSLHRRAGRTAKAVEVAWRALECATRAEARDEQAELLGELGSLHATLGEHEKALELFRRQAELESEVRSVEVQRRIAELEHAKEAAADERALAALERDRVRQELALSQQRVRQLLLALASAVLAAVAVGLFLSSRARARTLAAVRKSHADLERAADRLRESERRYHSVFEDAVVPRLLVDLGSRAVIEVNGPGGRLCLAEPGALSGRAFGDLEPAWLRRALEELGDSSGDVVSRVVEWRDGSGAGRHAELWSTPLALEGRPCALVTVHDVTERRRAEEEGIVVDKLESLGLLAGGIAHDFNNALTAVLGHVSLARMRARTGPEPELAQDLAQAEAAVDQARHLTTQLLAFAKGGEPRRELHDAKQLLWDAVNFATSGSGLQVEFDLAADLWAAELDGGQFQQTVSNLVINADQATEGSGRLVVRARNLDARDALSPTAGPGPYLVFEFEDSGPGIPGELREKVLEPYFTTKAGGSGLGLATVFAIVSRHAGWLELDSVVGRGTTFRLFFPALPDAQAAAARASGRTEAGRLTGSVLAMDDDPAVQGIYRALLTELGFSVEVVGDGEAAVERYVAARDAGERFDVVIMDLTVPGGMGGKAAMAELRRLDPDVLGVVSSGYYKDPVMSDYRAAGFAASLGKPFTVAGLGSVLRKVLQGREAPYELPIPRRPRVDSASE